MQKRTLGALSLAMVMGLMGAGLFSISGAEASHGSDFRRRVDIRREGNFFGNRFQDREFRFRREVRRDFGDRDFRRRVEVRRDFNGFGFRRF